jgi:hypothetical protein
VDPAIARLQRRLAQLSDYIDAQFLDCPVDVLIRLVALEAQNTSRLGRLIRDRQQAAGSQEQELASAIDAALDALSQELGIDL